MHALRLTGVVCLAAALLVAVLVATAGNLGFSIKTAAWSRWLPQDPEVTFAEGSRTFRVLGKPPVGALARRVDNAARFDPLATEPLLFAALEIRDPRQYPRAISLLEEARKRDPRSSDVRVALLDRYLRTENVAGAVDEIAVLGKLIPEDRQKLASLLTYLVATPETRHRAIDAVVQTNLRKSLTVDLANAGASSYLLRDITPDLDNVPPDGDDAAWASSIANILVRQGDFEGARRIWLHFFQGDHETDRNQIADPSFSGSPPPPFGWSLMTGERGRISYGEAGLRISYPGKDPATLAQQLMMLPPGRYELDYEASAGDGGMPNLSWQIRCAPRGEEVLSLAFVSIYSFENDEDNAFAIPPTGCEAQWLALVGKPLQVPNMQNATLSEVRIARPDEL